MAPGPTVIALFIYGLLPIIENAVAGLEGVPQAVREAAEGMGLSPWQRLRTVELPLAAPVILAGIRVSVTIAIGTATIGSTVGALTLGTPIFDGLVADKLPFVIEGAVLVALFAILTDMLFARLELWLRRGGRISAGREPDYVLPGAIVRAASAVMISDSPTNTMLMPTSSPIAQAAELGQPSQIR